MNALDRATISYADWLADWLARLTAAVHGANLPHTWEPEHPLEHLHMFAERVVHGDVELPPRKVAAWLGTVEEEECGRP